MRLVDYLDKGASLGADAPCLTMDGKDLSYGDVQRLSYRIAHGLVNSGVTPGEKADGAGVRATRLHQLWTVRIGFITSPKLRSWPSSSRCPNA